MSRQNPLPPRPTGAPAVTSTSGRGGAGGAAGGRGRGRGRGRGGGGGGGGGGQGQGQGGMRNQQQHQQQHQQQQQNVAYNPVINSSGGYPGYDAYAYTAAYGYGGAAGGYNSAGGYPNAAGGYPYAAAPSGGYPYAGYGYGYGYGHGYPAAPAASAPAPVPPTPTAPAAPAPTALAWRNCSQPGCKFTGPGDLVEQHEGDRHLLFPNGKPNERSEEEERYLANLKKNGIKPMIQGTGILLESEEDIAKWIAERKRKWPTRGRVEEKDKEDAEAVASGQNPRKKARMDPARAAEEWGRDPAEVREREAARSVWGRERGRGRGGARVGDRKPDAPATKAEQKQKSASSSSSDSSSDSDSSSSDSDSDSDEDSDDGDKTKANAEAPVKVDTRPVCRFFLRGRCRHGERCNNRHGRDVPAGGAKGSTGAGAGAGVGDKEKDGSKPAAERNPGAPKPPAPRQPPAKRANPFERPSMLGALLANPIQNTLSQLTQTIRFLAANDMLRNVETRPGQAAEQAAEREKVVLVEEVGVGGEVAAAASPADAETQAETQAAQ